MGEEKISFHYTFLVHNQNIRAVIVKTKHIPNMVVGGDGGDGGLLCLAHKGLSAGGMKPKAKVGSKDCLPEGS